MNILSREQIEDVLISLIIESVSEDPGSCRPKLEDSSLSREWRGRLPLAQRILKDLSVVIILLLLRRRQVCLCCTRHEVA